MVVFEGRSLPRKSDKPVKTTVKKAAYEGPGEGLLESGPGGVLAAEASLLSVVQSAERSLEARMGRLAAESAGLGLGEREEALS